MVPGVRMTYGDWHKEEDCDCCCKKKGVMNLYRAPFLYLDMNDKSHPDLGHGYRQYYLCKKCWRENGPRKKV